MIKQPYQVIKWYNGNGEQQFFKLQGNEKNWNIPKYHLYMPPSFVIKRDTRGHLVSSWYLRNLEGTVNFDMTDTNNNIYFWGETFDIQTSGDYDYLCWERFPLWDNNGILTPGYYYYELSDGIETWYSEIFELCDFWDHLANNSTNGVPSWGTQHIPTDEPGCLELILIEAPAGNGATNYTNDFEVVYNEKLRLFIYDDFTAGTDAIDVWLEESATGTVISDTYDITDGVNDFTLTPQKTCTARLRFTLPNATAYTGCLWIWLFYSHVIPEAGCTGYSVFRWSDPNDFCDSPSMEHYLIVDGRPLNNYTKIEEESVENDQKNKFPLIQTLQKWYNYILAGGDYLLEGLSTLRLHETVACTVETGQEIDIKEISLDSEPLNDFLYKITLDFREESCSKDACGQEIEECCCPTVENVLDYVGGGTGALPVCNAGTDGDRYIVNVGGDIRIYQCTNGVGWGHVTDEEVKNNCVYDEDTDTSDTYNNYWYFDVGAGEWKLLCFLSSIITVNNDGTAKLNGIAPTMDEFMCTIYVQAEYCPAGTGTWTEIGDPVSLAVFDVVGIIVDCGAGDWDFRVRYYSHACDLSYNGDLNKEIFTSDEMEDVWDAMTVKPNHATLQAMDAMMSSLIDGGYFAKAEFIDIFAVHTNANLEACINWHDPGTFNAIPDGPPAFTAYQGFTGNFAGVKFVDLNFNPVADGVAIGQDNICVVMGVGNNIQQTYRDFGASDDTDYLTINSYDASNQFLARCNSTTTIGRSHTDGKKHFAMSRNNAANFDMYMNLTKSNKVQASTGEVNANLFCCGYNNNGTPAASDRQVRYVMLFTYLTETEVYDVIGIMETYLDAIGTGLY